MRLGDNLGAIFTRLCVSDVQVLESMAPDIAGKVLGGSSRPLGERIWRLPRRLHPLDPTIRAVCTFFLQIVGLKTFLPSCVEHTQFRSEMNACAVNYAVFV
jgi:hypothetical protein